MGCKELCGSVHTDRQTSAQIPIGFCVSLSVSVSVLCLSRYHAVWTHHNIQITITSKIERHFIIYNLTLIWPCNWSWRWQLLTRCNEKQERTKEASKINKIDSHVYMEMLLTSIWLALDESHAYATTVTHVFIASIMLNVSGASW